MTNPLPQIIYDVEKRVEKLEKDSHPPVDFGKMFDSLEKKYDKLTRRVLKLERYVTNLERGSKAILEEMKASTNQGLR